MSCVLGGASDNTGSGIARRLGMFSTFCIRKFQNRSFVIGLGGRVMEFRSVMKMSDSLLAPFFHNYTSPSARLFFDGGGKNFTPLTVFLTLISVRVYHYKD